jgi:hypothetical protein
MILTARGGIRENNGFHAIAVEIMGDGRNISGDIHAIAHYLSGNISAIAHYLFSFSPLSICLSVCTKVHLS